MFVKSRYKNLNDVKREIHNDLLIPFCTVHDEVDFKIDNFLKTPIMKLMSERGAMKKVFDKLGKPYCNFLFDVEYNDNGSWIPSKEIKVYETPKTRKEHKLMLRFRELLEKTGVIDQEQKPEVEPDVYHIQLQDFTDDMLIELENLEDGNSYIKIVGEENTLTYRRKVKIEETSKLYKILQIQ